MKKASILIFQNKNKEILLLKTVKEGKWSLPGGKSEGDETYEETLAREVREETGYQIEDISKCKYFRDDATYGNGQEFHSFVYLLEVEKMFVPKLSLEHSKYKWIHPKEAIETLELRGNFTYSVMVQLLTGRQMFWPILGQLPTFIQSIEDLISIAWKMQYNIDCKNGSEVLAITNGVIDEIYWGIEGVRMLTEDSKRAIVYHNVEPFVSKGQQVLAGQKIGKTNSDVLKFVSYRYENGEIVYDSQEYLNSACIQ